MENCSKTTLVSIAEKPDQQILVHFYQFREFFSTLIHAMNSMCVSLKLGTNIASKQLLVFRLFDVCTQSNEN